MELLFNPDAWIGLLTLTVLEIVLGIDNVIFISILSGRLPVATQSKARRIGLALAMIMRVLLLLSLTWIMGLTRPLFSVLNIDVTGRALILIAGGLFLLTKSTREIHDRLEGEDKHGVIRAAPSLASVLLQIMLLDIVFSLDSVITAVGMAQVLWVMIAAVILAMIVMLIFVNQISDFVDRHPTIKMLALSFLILIGAMLVAEGLHHHIPKGYIYFAMAFSIVVEMLNLKLRKKSSKVELHQPYR